MFFLSKFIEPTECHSIKRFIFSNDLVWYKGQRCLVVTGLKNEIKDIPVDYRIEIRPTLSTVDIGSGCGGTVQVQSNDIDLVASE